MVRKSFQLMRKRMKTIERSISLAALAVLLCGLSSGCEAGKKRSQSVNTDGMVQLDTARSNGASDEERTSRFLVENEPRYRAAIDSAEQWLDGVKVDPLELRTHGIKGKKKVVELLDSYIQLHEIAQSPEDKKRLEAKILDTVAITYEQRFHNMGEIDDLQFKQDATSYLRAAYLMDRAGLDTELYRREIEKIHGRLDSHMKVRGSHQRMAFHWYYDHFGLEEPFDLAAGYEGGVIDSRRSPYKFTSSMDTYHLTHEIFIPYQYGEKLDADFFDEDELDYLRRTLERVTVYWMMRNNVDLTAELVSCMAFLKFTDSEIYREALEYILASQRENGSWGNYEGRGRKRYGDFVDQALYLHTTLVAIHALVVAFEARPQN